MFDASFWGERHLVWNCIFYAFTVLVLKTWCFFTLGSMPYNQAKRATRKLVGAIIFAIFADIITNRAWAYTRTWTLVVMHNLVQLWMPVVATMFHKWLNKRYSRDVASWLNLIGAAVSIFRWNKEGACVLVVVLWWDLAHHLVHWLLVSELEWPWWVHSPWAVAAPHRWDV